MANQELAEHWEDEYWEDVIRDSNLAAKVVKAKDKVVECAVRWHELDSDWQLAHTPSDRTRTALNDACRELQALRVQGVWGKPE